MIRSELDVLLDKVQDTALRADLRSQIDRLKQKRSFGRTRVRQGGVAPHGTLRTGCRMPAAWATSPGNSLEYYRSSIAPASSSAVAPSASTAAIVRRRSLISRYRWSGSVGDSVNSGTTPK